jgi:hypothetical protein
VIKSNKRLLLIVIVVALVALGLMAWGAAERALEREIESAYARSLAHVLYSEEQGNAFLGRPLIVLLRLWNDEPVRARIDEAVCFSYVFNGVYGPADELCARALSTSSDDHQQARVHYLRAVSYTHQAGRVPQALTLAEDDLRLVLKSHDYREAALPVLELIEILKRSIQEQQPSDGDQSGEPPDGEADPASWLQQPGAGDEGDDEEGY